MQARDEDGGRMSDKQLRGLHDVPARRHETTALALSWTWHLLGQNPEAEEKLHEELDRARRARRNFRFAETALRGKSDKESCAFIRRWAWLCTVIKEFERRLPHPRSERDEHGSCIAIRDIFPSR